VFLVLAAAGAGYVAYELTRSYAAFGEETFIDFPKGTSTTAMSNRLAQAGVIPHAWAFLAARVLYRRRALMAGEYRFSQPASVLEIYDRIARGDVFYYVLMVPEGHNMFEIAGAAEKLKLFPVADFLRAARDPAAAGCRFLGGRVFRHRQLPSPIVHSLCCRLFPCQRLLA